MLRKDAMMLCYGIDQKKKAIPDKNTQHGRNEPDPAKSSVNKKPGSASCACVPGCSKQIIEPSVFLV